MLRTQNNRIDTQWLIIFIVFDRYFSLGVRAQIWNRTILAQLGDLLHQLVTKHQRQRHIFRRFISSIAKHQPLVASTNLV